MNQPFDMFCSNKIPSASRPSHVYWLSIRFINQISSFSRCGQADFIFDIPWRYIQVLEAAKCVIIKAVIRSIPAGTRVLQLTQLRLQCKQDWRKYEHGEIRRNSVDVNITLKAATQDCRKCHAEAVKPRDNKVQHLTMSDFVTIAKLTH